MREILFGSYTNGFGSALFDGEDAGADAAALLGDEDVDFSVGASLASDPPFSIGFFCTIATAGGSPPAASDDCGEVIRLFFRKRRKEYFVYL